MIGASDPFRPRTGYDVTPVLAVVPPDLTICPNPEEVADWFEPPLAYVLDPTNRVPRTVEWEGAERTYFEIVWQQHRIWGVTAAIIGRIARGSSAIRPTTPSRMEIAMPPMEVRRQRLRVSTGETSK